MSKIFDLAKLIGYKYAPYAVKPTARDLCLYALGIGFQSDPLNRAHMKYTYEGHPNFQAFSMHPLICNHRVPTLYAYPGLPDFDAL